VRMCLANTHKLHVELAIDVFKTQNPALVISLKDFLTVLPNPKCIEEVLTEALYQLAETNPDACCWLLRNFSYLEPELDIAETVMQLALTKLMIENSACDRLLEEILQVHDEAHC